MHGIAQLHTHPHDVIFDDFSQKLRSNQKLFCKNLVATITHSNYNSLFFFFGLKYRDISIYFNFVAQRGLFTKNFGFVERILWEKKKKKDE